MQARDRLEPRRVSVLGRFIATLHRIHPEPLHSGSGVEAIGWLIQFGNQQLGKDDLGQLDKPGDDSQGNCPDAVTNRDPLYFRDGAHRVDNFLKSSRALRVSKPEDSR